MKLIERSTSEGHFRKVLMSRRMNLFHKNSTANEQKPCIESKEKANGVVSASKSKKYANRQMHLPIDDYQFAPIQKHAEEGRNPVFRLSSRKNGRSFSPNVSMKSKGSHSLQVAQKPKMLAKTLQKERSQQKKVKELEQEKKNYQSKVKQTVKSIKKQKQILIQKRKAAYLEKLMLLNIIQRLEEHTELKATIGRTKKLSSLQTESSDKFSDYGLTSN